VVEQQPCGKPEPHKGLDALDHDHGALQPKAGACPLNEQALVLTPDGPFCPMRTHSDKATQRVKIETA